MNRRLILDRAMGVFVLAVMVGLVVFIYIFGSVLSLDVVALVIGSGAGVIAVVALYNHLSQEKKLVLPAEEKVLLKSSGGKSYVVFNSIGEQDFPLNPVRADIYLTNIGILAEPPGSGESILYVPHYRVSEFVPYMANGIRLRYFDINDQLCEVVIYVEDRNEWSEKHLKILEGQAV